MWASWSLARERESGHLCSKRKREKEVLWRKSRERGKFANASLRAPLLFVLVDSSLGLKPLFPHLQGLAFAHLDESLGHLPMALAFQLYHVGYAPFTYGLKIPMSMLHHLKTMPILSMHVSIPPITIQLFFLNLSYPSLIINKAII